MNFIVYNGQAQVLRRFNTEAEAVAWVRKTVQDWRNAGAPRIPRYEVCHNGSSSTLLFSSNEKGQTTQHVAVS